MHHPACYVSYLMLAQGVNDIGPNHATLHTDKGCLMLNTTQHKG